jgi:hypothetical protein
MKAVPPDFSHTFDPKEIPDPPIPKKWLNSNGSTQESVRLLKIAT